MSGLRTAMDTSLSALFAAQVGMATTGHNIANANMRGYSRQQVMTSARRPQVMPWGSIGQGVNVDTIRRVQDEFLARNMRNQSTKLEAYTTVDAALAEVESIMGSVDNDQVGTALDKFFAAWNSLAQPPVNDDLKENVVQMAQSLVRVFHSIDAGLTDLARDIEDSLQAEVQNLNTYLTEVGRLNQQIMAAEVGGQPANDLRDRRDAIVLEVSKLAEVSTLEREDGSIVLIMEGRTVVSRGSVTLFDTVERPSGTSSQVFIVTAETHRDVKLPEGRLRGLLESRDIHVAEVRRNLDEVVAKLASEMNALHIQGRTDQSSGLTFFSGDNLHTIDINPALLDRPDLVATGRTSADGDNELALLIANLMNESVDGPEADTVSDVYRATLINAAGKRATFDFMVENQQNMVATVDAKIASVSGVSLDEEGANMINYQNSYTAAARVISVVQDMYETLLNMV